MIYDCFSFFNEHTVLEIRLNTLWDKVDKFILVEATRSHQNLPKPLHFAENKELYSKYMDKILHVVVDEYPEYSYWSFEENQRDQIFIKLQQIASDDDLIFISDVDEIWNPAKLDLTDLQPGKMYLWASYICYRYFNLAAQKEFWYQPKYLLFSTLRDYCEQQGLKLSHDVLRNKSKRIPKTNNILLNYLGGWHFSYTEDVEHKLQNFLHREFRDMKLEHFMESLTKRKNPFHGNEVFLIEDLENYLPDYVLKNKDKFQNYILTQ